MSNLKYTVLFGGGAVRGLAYVGTLRALEELGVEYDIIGGSSVGAILAALIACGYKSYELENLFMKVNFELFSDIHLGFGKAFAISKGERFVEWLNELISRDIQNPEKRNIKFQDIKQKLVIITTNLKTFQTQEFSNLETPDFDVAKAIRISSSMPGLMPPFNYKGADLVDGDLQKASPMWKLSENLNNSKSRILEFRLEGDCSNEAKNPVSFINTIYSCITDVATDFVSEIYGKNDRYDCVRINTGDIFFADFNLDRESRRKLIESGYNQTMKYFKEVLPNKKETLNKVYSKLCYYLKQAYKGLRTNNVEEVQWWMGDLFTELCENKEMVDENIIKVIFEFKELMDETETRSLIFFNTRFKRRKELDAKIKELIGIIEERISDIRLYLRSVKGVSEESDELL